MIKALWAETLSTPKSDEVGIDAFFISKSWRETVKLRRRDERVEAKGLEWGGSAEKVEPSILV